MVFTRTEGFRHSSIAAAVSALEDLGNAHGFTITATEDPTVFTPPSLAAYEVVAFVLTTGDVLDSPQELALKEHIESGAGFVGIHSATDTEYTWPWYRQLVGARFAGHPPTQPGVIRVQDRRHPSSAPLPRSWHHADEWYDFDANPRREVHVLAVVSERSYEGGSMGSDHPIAWCHGIGSGRSWYSALGHPEEAYSDADFRAHLAGGIVWAAEGSAVKCSPRNDRDTVTLSSLDGGRVGGAVFASPKCSRRRSIALIRVRNGRDVADLHRRTNRSGGWGASVSTGGDYRVVAPADAGCRALRSSVVPVLVPA